MAGRSGAALAVPRSRIRTEPVRANRGISTFSRVLGQSSNRVHTTDALDHAPLVDVPHLAGYADEQDSVMTGFDIGYFLENGITSFPNNPDKHDVPHYRIGRWSGAPLSRSRCIRVQSLIVTASLRRNRNTQPECKISVLRFCMK